MNNPITVTQAAARWGVSVSTVWRWIRVGVDGRKLVYTRMQYQGRYRPVITATHAEAWDRILRGES